MYLLDVNVLLSLLNEDHVHYERCKHWFHRAAPEGWATCPLTENGFLRIEGSRLAAQGIGDQNSARLLLEDFCLQSGHCFWPDELSMRDRRLFPKLSGPKHLTDCYLLALAFKRQAKSATLDARIDPSHVKDSAEAYFLVP